MGNMAQNDYHDIAQQIVDQEKESTAPKEKTLYSDEEADPAVAAKAEAAMNGEQLSEEDWELVLEDAWNSGSEKYYSEMQSIKAMQTTDGDLYNQSGAEMVEALGYSNVSEEEIAWLDTLSPEEKQTLVQELNASDGLGSINHFMKQANKTQ